MNIWRSIGRHAEENFILASLILLILFFGFSSDNFFSVITLTTILNQLPALTFVTVGMTLVLIVAGIDLSVGSVMGFCAAVVGVAAVAWGLPLWVACLMGLGTGLICGTVNGLLVAYFSLPSFIVTLGMLEMARGLGYLTTGSQTVYIGSQIQSLALPLPGIGVSAALISAIVLVIAAQFVLTKTVLGRYLVAIGTNEQAARMSGIDPRPYRLMVLAVSGALAGIAGIFQRGLPGVCRSQRRNRAGAIRYCGCRYWRNQPDGWSWFDHRRLRRRIDNRRATKRAGANWRIRTDETIDYRCCDHHCRSDRPLEGKARIICLKQ